MKIVTKAVLILPLLFSGMASAVTHDCKFPPRNSKSAWVNAGQGGSWEKRGFSQMQKGYFRFIYYRKGYPSPTPRVFVEAWEHMSVGHDLFVGCIEVKDKDLAAAADVGTISFRAADDKSINLDIQLYAPSSNPNADNPSKQHSVTIPFTFIDNIE